MIFLNNEEAQKDFLENMLDTMLYMMRKNTVTGSFLILANDSDGYAGKYLRRHLFQGFRSYGKSG